MDSTIALFLVQDGLTNGAIYALLGFALLIVFSVTRVILLPQGEFVAFGGLTYAALRAGQVPGTAKLLVLFAAAALLSRVWVRRRALLTAAMARDVAFAIVPAIAVWALLALSSAAARPPTMDAILTILIVAPMGPYLYRIAFEPLAEASVLTLLIAAVAVHLAMTALGLAFFGPEGLRAPPLVPGNITVGPLQVSGQSLAVYFVALLLIGGLWLLFDRTLYGKALRATAINRAGARLSGIATEDAGSFAFGLAAAIGAVSGILIVPVTTLYYDTGFLIGLMGFVAAIVGGLASYPLTGLAAIAVGIAEAFASFEASAFKEVIVFALVIPVLLMRSLGGLNTDDEES